MGVRPTVRPCVALIVAVTVVATALVMTVPAQASDPAGTVSLTRLPGISGQELTQITSGPDGNLWFTERYENAVVKMTPAGELTKFTAGITANSQPTSLATGPDGNVWFAQPNVYDAGSGTFQVAKITPDGVVTQYPSPVQPPSGNQGIVSGPGGALWYTQSLGQNIVKMTTDGVATTFATGLPFLSFLWALAVGPDGNLWFTSTSRIGKMTPSGTVATYTAGLANTGLIPGLTAGPDGNMWFTLPGVNKLGKITMDGAVTTYDSGLTADASPVGLTTGADGNLWFTEGGSGGTPPVRSAIGRVTTSGVIDEFPIGDYASNDPSGITPGSDGNIWAVDILDPKVVRVSTGESAPNSSPVVSSIKPLSARISGVVYSGAASSVVTLQCARDPLFQSVVYSKPASSGSPATGTSAAAVSGSCSGLVDKTTYYSRFVSSSTFPGSSWSSTWYSTITAFKTANRRKQSLRKGSVPTRIRDIGTTVINKRGATTKQALPLSAKVFVRQSQVGPRGDVNCIRVKYSAKRKVTVKTTGACALRIKVIYTAPGSAAYYPLKKAFTFTTTTR